MARMLVQVVLILLLSLNATVVNAFPITIKTFYTFDSIRGMPYEMTASEFPDEIELELLFDTDDGYISSNTIGFYSPPGPFSFDIQSGIPKLDK